MKNQTWSEINQVTEKGKRDLKLTGTKSINQKVEQLSGKLDENLWSLTSLHKLEIVGIDALTTISPAIGELKHLKELVVSENVNVDAIPKEIGQLKDLKILILSDNELITIPFEIGLLSSLQILSVSGNKLTSLPNSLGNLVELLTLNASKNQITSIPSLENLTRLSTLSLEHNSISEVPEFLGHLTGLQVLNLQSNQLTEVPSVLGLSPKLRELNLENNPFKDKKFIKLLQSGKTKNILAHLKKLAPQPEKEEITSKLRIVLRPPITSIPYRVLISPLQTIRPYITMVIMRDVTFTPELFQTFIDLQTNIHQILCNKRTLAALGTHDLYKIKGPFKYEAKAPSQIKFVPLKQTEEFTGEELFRYCQSNKDETMMKYFNLIKKDPLWPVVTDSTGQVLSLHPIINSKYSEISLETKNILVECSSTENAAICKQALITLLGRYSKIYSESTGQVLFVEQVHVCTEELHVLQRFPVQLDLQDACKID